MTVPTTSATITYTGDGATTTFSFPFACDAPTSIGGFLTTISTGAITILGAGQFSVTLNPAIAPSPTPVGGLFTLAGPPMTSAQTLTITRDVPSVQNTSFSNQSIVYPTAIEAALDSLVMIDQQNSAAAASPLVNQRAFQVGPSDPIPALVPALSLRVNKPAVFDINGNLTFGASVPSLTVGTTTISGGISSGPDVFLVDVSGVLQEVNSVNAMTNFPVFTSSLKGVTPASGGGTTKFLRADGTWQVPAGGGGGTPGGADTQLQYNNIGAFGGISGVTTNGADLTALHIDDLTAIFWKDNTTILGVYDAGLGRGAAKVLQVNDGTGLNVNGWIQSAGKVRTTSDFTVASNTTLANISGLSVTLQASRVYTFEVALLLTTAASAGGIKVALSGTTTVTNLIVDGLCVDGTTNIACSQVSVLNTNIVSNVNAGTTPKVRLFGTIETGGTGGTFTVQFAQSASNASGSTVKRGSWMWVHDTP